MIVTIESSTSVPVFEQLADQLRAQLADGRIPVGSRLPSARELAEQLGINLHTVLHAYQALRDEGLIALRRGSGAVAIAPAHDLAPVRAAIAELVAAAKRQELALPTITALLREEFAR